MIDSVKFQVSPDVSLAEFYVVGYRQRRVLEVTLAFDSPGQNSSWRTKLEKLKHIALHNLAKCQTTKKVISEQKFQSKGTLYEAISFMKPDKKRKMAWRTFFASSTLPQLKNHSFQVLTSGNYSRLCADILFARSMGYYIIQVLPLQTFTDSNVSQKSILDRATQKFTIFAKTDSPC